MWGPTYLLTVPWMGLSLCVVIPDAIPDLTVSVIYGTYKACNTTDRRKQRQVGLILQKVNEEVSSGNR